MVHDSPERPTPALKADLKADLQTDPKAALKPRRSSKSDLPQDDLTLDTSDVDPESSATEEDDEARLPEASEDAIEPVAEGTLSIGHEAIENAVRLAPTSPGVYRMLNAANDVLYVGKAKNVKKRL